jgi:hypothetical protein
MKLIIDNEEKSLPVDVLFFWIVFLKNILKF